MKAFEISNREPGQIMRSLMSEALLDVEFAVTLREIFIDSRRHALRDILARSIKRGKISPKVEIELMIDLIQGPMWYRLLNKHAPLDKAFAHQLSKTITAAYRARMHHFSAVVGSITERTSAMRLAGNPPVWACCRTTASFGAI